MDGPSLEYALQGQVADILNRCTSCGACVEVCPMPAPAGIDASDPGALAAGVLTVLRGGSHADAQRWAAVCSGSGLTLGMALLSGLSALRSLRLVEPITLLR